MGVALLLGDHRKSFTVVPPARVVPLGGQVIRGLAPLYLIAPSFNAI
jgi:hypothetical protein